MFQVIISAARMPASCWGKYVRVAVVETDGRPAKIIRTYGPVKRIIKIWEKCRVGKTEKSSSARAIRAAEELATKLNARRSNSVNE